MDRFWIVPAALLVTGASYRRNLGCVWNIPAVKAKPSFRRMFAT
jgi:hypothetical protein